MYELNNSFYEDKFLDEYYKNLKNKNKEVAEKIFKQREENSIKISWSSVSWYQTILTAFYLFHPNINPLTDNSFLTDWFDDCSFDAIYINSEYNIVEIFDSKWKETENSKWTWFWDKELAFLEKNIDTYISDRKTYDWSNEVLSKKIIELRSALDKWYSIRVYIFREISFKPDESYLHDLKNIELKLSKKWVNINLKCININEAKQIIKYNLLNIEWKPFSFNNWNEKKEQIELKYQIWITNESDNTFLWISSLYEYYNFIQNAYDKIWKTEIYKFNVRQDQKNEEILRNIENTIKSDCNNFLHFHNWITIISEKIENSKWRILNLENPQIINWCQSTNAIYHAFSKHFEIKSKIENGTIDDLSKDEIIETYKVIDNLKKSSIQLKILPIKINSDRSYTIEKISEYTNTQIKVDKFQLRSNDLIHYILIDYLRQNWFIYKPKELETKSNKEIAIDELFQLIFAYLYEVPWTAKNEKQDIFSIKEDSNWYLEILNKTSIEEILKIVKSNYVYLEKWPDGRKSLLRFFVILSLLFLDKYWKVNIDNEISNIWTTTTVQDILETIYILRNSSKYKNSKAERDVYQVKWDIFWADLKEKLREKYSILDTNKEHIEIEGIKLTAFNEYIKDYWWKWRIRKQHELIKDILNDNQKRLSIDIIVDSLLKMYASIWRQNDYFSNRAYIESTIKDKPDIFENEDWIIILK